MPFPSIPFADLALASIRVASTRARLQKQRFIVEALGKTPSAEVAAAVGWLVEEPLCGPLGVGPATLWGMSGAPAPDRATMTLHDVEEALAHAREGRREEVTCRVTAVFDRLTTPERALFVGALTGSLRQGSLGGVMVLALAQLSGRTEEEVRRAVMVTGSIPRAAEALLGPRAEAVPPSRIVLFHPVAPMLAASAASVQSALAGLAEPLVEWKIDGVRAQVHKEGDVIAVYSRQGNEITSGCGPLLPSLASLSARSAVLDGEVVLIGHGGVARAFQDSFSVVASKAPPSTGDELRIYLFDCLHRDGADLMDEPLSVRLAAIKAVVPPDLRMPNVQTTSVDEALRFHAEARAAGHEGVMVKDLSSPYRLGARGRAWQKVKEFSTVDLVVLAAEWGSGRRRGSLSNLHLGARRPDGSFCMVGKTFKGLTDAMLRWQTGRLEQLAAERTERAVFVRPELVVEIRYNDVQRSRRYPGGIALRFARVVRYREDKPASEAEPLENLVARLPDPIARVPARPGGSRTLERSERADPNTNVARAAPKKRRRSPKQQLSLFDD